MRIVTRPDFDGIVCAVLLKDALDVSLPVKWVEPYEIKDNKDEIGEGDIVANLPYVEGCSLWFDHHITNKTDQPFEGAFADAPSAAGIIFAYYTDKFSRDFSELVRETDRIDSADISIDEVLNPERNPYVVLANTISGRHKEDEYYWNMIVDLLVNNLVEQVLANDEVQKRSTAVVEQDRAYKDYLQSYTTVADTSALTDFRSLAVEPKGNRFMVYSLFPDILVDMKVRFAKNNREKVIISLGQNIFNKGNNVDLGTLAARYGGGGHPGAGSCSCPAKEADRIIEEIVTVLANNKIV